MVLILSPSQSPNPSFSVPIQESIQQVKGQQLISIYMSLTQRSCIEIVGSTPPYIQIYPPFTKESQAMAKYIEDLIVKRRCDFHFSKISILGQIFSPDRVLVQDKVMAIKNWPIPTTIKELQQFLRFPNSYRRRLKFHSCTLHGTSQERAKQLKLHLKLCSPGL